MSLQNQGVGRGGGELSVALGFIFNFSFQSFFLSFFFFKRLYWSIIALQWCVSFYFIKKNQLYIYIYPHISSLLYLPPTLPIPLL